MLTLGLQTIISVWACVFGDCATNFAVIDKQNYARLIRLDVLNSVMRGCLPECFNGFLRLTRTEMTVVGQGDNRVRFVAGE